MGMSENSKQPELINFELAKLCREWLKSCTCAPADKPQECKECTSGFLEALINKAKQLGLTIGENALPKA